MFRGVIDYLNPDKMDDFEVMPGETLGHFTSWRDWFRFMLFVSVFLIPLIVVVVVDWIVGF